MKKKVAKKSVKKTVTKKREPHFGLEVAEFVQRWGERHGMDQQMAYHTLREFCDMIIRMNECDCGDHE